MIIVNENTIKVKENIPEIATDIHAVYEGIFETQCTQTEEVIELIQAYERFRNFKESRGN